MEKKLHDFKVGDRIKFSDKWNNKMSYKIRSKKRGVVISIIKGDLIKIILDGNSSPSDFHYSFIDHE